MPFAHVLLALVVVLVWGVNFLFVKFALDEMSPLLLCALRFVLASLPAVFFIKPPKVPFTLIASYGLVMFALQFSLLFLGMHAGMTPGMASLIIQVQVFFSLFFAVVFLKEQPHLLQIMGAIVSFAGIGLVALHLDSHITLTGFLFILAAAATWGVGNLITKKFQGVNMMAVVVWGSFVASIPMLLLSLLLEGPASMVYTYRHINWLGMGSLFYIVYISTWVGYGVWNWLISRYPVGMVVPYTLLVPVVGVFSSIIVLGEPFELWKVAAGLLVICGLMINILSTRLVRVKLQPAA
ncbi:integral membrane protein [Legionella rubrilucens]|uniref:Integral membrane protein n=1 Tax=Legionella rubrilucens TaxID=458 RepID=A0A0W0XMB2_9GAMM|nr:EamA family transporter [Legionella rubrilucens]KTD45740.1 integral membrane protein [Legionella rubrilucens]